MRLAREAMQTFSGGVNNTSAPSELRANELSALTNGRISLQGNAIERRMGSRRTHASALNGGKLCWGAKEFTRANGNIQIVTFFGDKMYVSVDDGETWSEEASGLLENYWSLAVMRVGNENVLCCANGGTTYKWDGDSLEEITGIEDDVRYLQVFNDRLIGAGHSGIDVIASAVGDPDTWAIPDGWTIKASTHEGDTEIRGLFQLGSVLLVFKKESVGYIEGYGYETLQVAAGAQGISRSVGLAATRSIASIGDQGVMWLSERGWEFYEIGGRITLVSRTRQEVVDDLNRDVLRGNPGIPTALWWPEKQEYWCAVPTGSSNYNNRTFVFRPPTQRAPAASWDFSEIEPDPITDGDTVSVDDDGYLNHEDGDNAQFNMQPNEDGYLELDTETGFVDVGSDGYLSFLETLIGKTVLFSAVRGVEAEAPYSAHIDGFVRYEEYEAEQDDVLSDGTGGFDISLRASRPFLFGDQFAEKVVRRASIVSEQDGSATINLTVKGDDGSGNQKSLAFASGAHEEKARVRKRARVFTIDIDTTDAVKITGLNVIASLLREPV